MKQLSIDIETAYLFYFNGPFGPKGRKAVRVNIFTNSSVEVCLGCRRRLFRAFRPEGPKGCSRNTISGILMDLDGFGWIWMDLNENR